jgi:SCP-2 sterol transfer family
MPQNALRFQEYFETYVPELVTGYLAEEPVPDMEGTSFTTQFTVDGQKSLVFGITIDNAKEISVQPEGLEKPMVSITVPEDFIRLTTRQVSALTGRKQYDAVLNTKGTLVLEMEMPGGVVLPVTIVFNGTSEPQATMSGPADVIAGVMTGQIQGPQAFMEGKIKISGDVMFLMSLATLVT